MKWIGFSLSLIVLVGCGVGASSRPYEPRSIEANPEEVIEPDNQFIIWSAEDFSLDGTSALVSRHSDLNITHEQISRSEIIDRYYEALRDQRPPDLLLIPDEFVGLFSEIDGLFDFNEPAFKEGGYLNHVPDEVFHRYQNLSGDQYAVPVRYTPHVTFYRHDVMASYDLPSDPEGFGAYIRDKERFIDLVKRLEADDVYIFETNQALIQTALRVAYPFDADYRYTYSDGPFQDVLDSVAMFHNQDIRPGYAVWGEYGQEQIRNGTLVMFQLPFYGVDHLKNWAPEQSGKWRVTNLPFGLAGLDREFSTVAMIPENSGHKEVAFQFIRDFASYNNYLVDHQFSEPFLDQTGLNLFYRQIIAEPTAGKPSMLDLHARRHWFNSMFDINRGMFVSDLLFSKTHDRLREEVRLDQRILIEHFIEPRRAMPNETISN